MGIAYANKKVMEIVPTKKTTKKRSDNARQVARKVSENIGTGKKVDLGEIIRKQGYSDKTSQTPQRVTETKSYQEEIAPIVAKMMQQRERMMEAIANKNLDKNSLRDLVDGIDKLTKNVQLLSGKDTSKNNVVFGWEE